jgi:hypothetical protein
VGRTKAKERKRHMTHMRRKTDRWVLSCTVIAFLCLTVQLVVTPTVLHNRGTLIDIKQAEARQVAAIVASCEVLNAKIVESQMPPSKNSSTAYLIGLILKNTTPAELKEFQRRVAAEQARGPRLPPANCESEAARALKGRPTGPTGATGKKAP